MFQKWDISTSDIISLTTDNVKNMVKYREFFEELGTSFFRCFAHTLQLVVKDALKSVSGLSTFITQARVFVSAIHTSHVMMKQYKSICKERFLLL